MLPITEAQAQAVVDGFLTWLETKESTVGEKLATEIVRKVIDNDALPALWAYLKQTGVVSSAQ